MKRWLAGYVLVLFCFAGALPAWAQSLRGLAAQEGGGSAPAAGDKLPETLDAMLIRAVSSNPDVLTAEARLRQAQAELHQVRLKTIQEVTTAYHEWQAAKDQLAAAQAMFKAGEAQQKDLLTSRQAAAAAEAQLRYLLAMPAGIAGEGGMMVEMAGAGAEAGIGMGGRPLDSGSRGAGQGFRLTSPAASRQVPAHLAEKLNKEVDLEFVEMSLGDATAYLQDATGVQFLVAEDVKDLTFSIKLRRVPLKAALQAIADTAGVVFVLRDYGIFVANPEQFLGTNAATIPENLGGGGLGGGGLGGGGGFF